MNGTQGSWNNFTPLVTPVPFTNTTEISEGQSYPESVGFICAIIAVVVYGSNNVPVKKFSTGDGIFFQFAVCNGIFLVGIVLQLIRNSKFFPLVMLGGVIWTTGNLTVVPIIKTIGMGLGISVWGTVGLLTGWASGKFGWFGMSRDKISHVDLNYGGVVVAAVSILLYILVKDEVSSAKSGDENDAGATTSSEASPLLPQLTCQDSNSKEKVADDRLFFEDFSPTTKRLLGLSLSVISGVCDGLTFVPSIYVQDNYGHEGATKNGLDYVFAQFCGIYLTSSVYFYIYCLMKKNNPKVYPKAILPGVTSGVLWGVATASWMVANAVLSQSVSYPIVSTGPCAVASLFWGVCVFREIRGMRNIVILVLGLIVMTVGALLAGFSR